MSKTIAIIGAGLAGLSAGCYAQMNGYRSRIFEMHTRPGGLCTSWKRQGYTFDGCVHWVQGSKNEGKYNRMWHELGVLPGREIVNHEELMRLMGSAGKTLIVYTNIDRLEKEMKELSPADTAVIDELCKGLRDLAWGSAPVQSATGVSKLLIRIKDVFKLLLFVAALRKFTKISVQDFAARFSDPFLREVFPSTVFGLPEFPMMGLMTTLARMHNCDAGYPVGGSLEFARTVEGRYLDLGGEIHYGSRVEEILVRDDRAEGIRLADGAEHPADFVVSAADGYSTIFGMLQGKYVDDKTRQRYAEWRLFPPLVQVSLGVARDFSTEPHLITYPLTRPIMISEEEQKWLCVRHYCYDPTMASSGKSVLVIPFYAKYDYWKNLYPQRELYDGAKQKILTEVIDRLEKRFPGISDQVEATDVSTPVTTERYTGNRRGTWAGWLVTTQTIGQMARPINQTLPGLQNFYMAGQWVSPGGLPQSAMSGQAAIKQTCKQDKRPFETQTPDR